MEKKFKKSKIPIITINLVCVLSLFIIITPLLSVAKYDYPSADDWSYGINAYQTVLAGGNIFQVLFAAVERAKEAYLGWDGRFANDFLDSLQPGIWGEQYYALTPWILIGMLIVSELLFFRFLICCKTKDQTNRMLWIPIVVPVLITQILFTPSPIEGFYWYTGGMNYSFMYGLSLILMILFMKLGVQEFSAKGAKVLTAIAACILSVFLGGGNFSTSLSTVLVFCAITILFLIRKKHDFIQRTWYVTLILTVCLIVCLLSPGSIKGNSARITGGGNPLLAIWQSLTVSAKLACAWTFTGQVLLLLLFMLPFIWRAVENIEIPFRCPLLFSLLTFGIYASQVTPNLYTTGYLGGARQEVILYYSYIVWLTGNLFYWMGWLKKMRKAVTKQNSLLLLVYCGVIGIFFLSFIYIFEKKNISCYKVYRDWRQGWAQQYAAEWESRLEILHDDSIKEVIFEPISVYPEALMYTDLQPEDGYIWVNDACAQYYDKESIQVK